MENNNFSLTSSFCEKSFFSRFFSLGRCPIKWKINEDNCTREPEIARPNFLPGMNT